ncbi:hypothetical protein GCM10027599_10950 [Yimella radicis]
MSRFTIASNQGDIAGGEVMLLQLAAAARDLGHDVTVVGPASPPDLCDRAANEGFDVVRIPGANARSYLRNLRRWDRQHRRGLLWCNGLRPAFATTGHPCRVVHLHQVAEGKLKVLAAIARRGVLRTVVPSRTMQSQVARSDVLMNWSLPPAQTRPPRPMGDPVRLGFLGRLSPDKGVLVLADTMRLLEARAPGRYTLLLAGATRFVPPREATAVEESLARLGTNVERVGWMDRDAFFSQVDLAVFPSTWAEPFGLVVTEAMAARCPFVISDAGALPEVAGSDFPWIARAGDAASLAAVLAQAVTGYSKDHTDNSYDRWSQFFSPEAGTRELGIILDELRQPGAGGSS